MSWIWVKLITGIIFVLVPGFTLKENFKKHPYLTIISIMLGFFLLFLSLKPLVDSDNSRTEANIRLLAILERLDDLEEQRSKDTLNLSEQERLSAETIELNNEIIELRKKLGKPKNSKNTIIKEKNVTHNNKDTLVNVKTRFGQFIDNHDGTVIDTKSNLMWKRCSEGQGGNNCTGEVTKTSWSDAMYNFQQSSFAGYNDWRIPSREELSTLIYCSNDIKPQSEGLNHACATLNKNNGNNYKTPTIMQAVFPATANGVYWSSSLSELIIYKDFEDFKNIDKVAWGLNFKEGYGYDYKKKDKNYLRLVRIINN